MNYQDLGGPTPFNYRPDDDSSKLSIGKQKKVKKVCSAFRKKRQEEQDQEMRGMAETIYNFSKAVTIEEGKKKSKKVKKPFLTVFLTLTLIRKTKKTIQRT